MDGATTSTSEAVDHHIAESRRQDSVARVALRYSLSSFGPIAISGAHFLASILFLRALSRAEFGLLSFLFILVPFCLSISGALVGASVSRAAARMGGLCREELDTHLKVNTLLSVGAGTCVFVLLKLSRSQTDVALLLGLYACLMTLRWFGRNVSYALRTPLRVPISDVVYAGVVVSGLGALYAAHRLDGRSGSVVLAIAALGGVIALGGNFLRPFLKPSKDNPFQAFGGIWRDLARWSVLGVVLTELTANAHVYLVTFAFGPASFALLAVGSLLMRPAVLVLSALPDLERPEMARRIVVGDRDGALRSVKEFRTAAGAVWLATFLLAGAVLMWFPYFVVKHGYESGQVLVVLLFWGAITAVRVARTPESVLLQAAGEFRSLAAVSCWSSVTSLVTTLLLMLSLGPVASLGGVLIGDLVMTVLTFSLSRRWKRDNG
jgi:O-antigen/teichoic acid export membrane protein